ncbi:MAG: MBL fold metallo-hydrolase [Polyangiaceae bacterium]
MFARCFVRAAALSTLALALLGCAAKSAPSPPPAPARAAKPRPEGLSMTYLGVAGWRIDDGANVLLLDPNFSRPHIVDLSVELVPNETEISRYAPPHATAILVGHSHYDHLLDVPEIARRTGAKVVGSESTLNVARASGLPEGQLVLAAPGATLTFGPFAVRPLRGRHSLTGLPNLPIPRNVAVPLAAGAYHEGGTFHYLLRVRERTILFIGTANFIETEMEGLRPDVAIIASGLREKVPDYACRLMRALGRPRLVFANHFDAFQEPLGPSQMNLEDAERVQLAAFADEIHACAPETKVVIPVHLDPMAI